MQSLIPEQTNIPENPQSQNNPSAKVNSLPKKAVKSWEVLLSESSGSENELEAPRKPKIKEKVFVDKKVALREHDYCHAIYKMLKEEEKKPEDLSEMDKILSNVALGAFEMPTQPIENSQNSAKMHSKI